MFVFISVALMLMLLIQAKEQKSYVIDGDVEDVFAQAKPMMSLWKNGRVANVDNVNRVLEIKTKMTVYSMGERVKIQFKALQENRVAITISSSLNIGLWDVWDTNQKNLKQFEEIMGLEPSIATYSVKHITQ